MESEPKMRFKHPLFYALEIPMLNYFSPSTQRLPSADQRLKVIRLEKEEQP